MNLNINTLLGRTLNNSHLAKSILLLLIIIGIPTAFLASTNSSQRNAGQDSINSPEASRSIEEDPTIGTEDNPLTLGIIKLPILPDNEISELVSHLEESLNLSVTADIIDIEQSGLMNATKQRIQTHSWDLVFAIGPIFSVYAEDNDYDFAAVMWPDNPNKQFESALFVRNDSSIQGIDDLTSDNKIALGEFGNVVSFYMPVYDLFGMKLNLDIENTPGKIVEKVRLGVADVGALPYQKLVGDPQLNQSFRTILRSRALAVGGVYLSPKLSDKLSKEIGEELLNISDSITLETPRGNPRLYADGDKPDYTEFKMLVSRVEEILGCVTDWNQQPIELYECVDIGEPINPENTPGIVGKTDGYVRLESGYRFLLRNLKKSGPTYFHLHIPYDIYNRDHNLPEPPEFNSRFISINPSVVVDSSTPPKISITDIGQIETVKIVQ